jgi:hypothetical protein
VTTLIVISLILLLRLRSKFYNATMVGDHASYRGNSEKLGKGGFGCVFKRMLPGCNTICDASALIVDLYGCIIIVQQLYTYAQIMLHAPLIPCFNVLIS